MARGIRHLTDARYFSAWQVDWLGFDLTSDGLDLLSLEEVKQIREWIEGPEIIGELDFIDLDKSIQTMDYLDLENILSAMHTPREYLTNLGKRTLFQEIVVKKNQSADEIEKQMEFYHKEVDYFLLDFQKNDIGWREVKENNRLDFNHIKQLCKNNRVFIDLNFSTGNIQSVLDELKPYGITLKGGLEEKTGYKSFEELDELLALIED